MGHEYTHTHTNGEMEISNVILNMLKACMLKSMILMPGKIYNLIHFGKQIDIFKIKLDFYNKLYFKNLNK